jgi:uncharacterized membrane protein (UPF0136 family)
MNVPGRLPKRLVWAALLFFFTGAGTASAEIEDFAGQVASTVTGEATAALSVGAVGSLIIGLALGILYVWAGYGLLRRQERWRRRAVYLSRFFIGLFGLAALAALFGEVTAIELGSLSSGEQQAGDLQSGNLLTFLWTFRALALVVIGAATSAYWWALRVLQSDSIRREFLREKEEAPPPRQQTTT